MTRSGWVSRRKKYFVSFADRRRKDITIEAFDISEARMEVYQEYGAGFRVTSKKVGQ